MREPRRWLDDASTPPQLRAVLNARGSLPAMPGVLHKELRAYAVGLTMQGVTQTAAGSWMAKGLVLKSAAGAVGKVALVVSLMGAAGTAGYVAVGYRLEQTQSTREPVAAQAPRGAANALKQATASVSSSGPTSLPIQPSQMPQHGNAPSDPPPPQSPKPALANSAPTTTLSDEAQLLETARESLDHPARALTIVRRHELRYPNGQLGAERDLIAVDALLRLGRRSEAERRAAPRLRQDQNSLYAKRLRQLLGNE